MDVKRNEERLRLSQFLRDKGCYDRFMKNFFQQDLFENLDVLCTKHEHAKLIEKAFNWAGTKEGVGFWQRMSVLWSASLPTDIEVSSEVSYLAYRVDDIIEDEELGNLVVEERADGTCHGCIFNIAGKDCKNKKYGCSPYTRGDATHVVFTKL